MQRVQATRERLERGLCILRTIRRRRRETGCRTLGWAIERAIVDRELRELEEEMQSDSAAVPCEPVQFLEDLRLGGRILRLDLLEP